jgi:2-polyprenyl-3-methyl-5-hydroxy-6-metoxy-1,4-benzoquinol methylase
MGDGHISSRIWSVYAGCPLGLRLLAWARTWICPFPKVLAHAPPAGKFVEIGCGTGIAANLLALDGPQRMVTGYDLNARVIAAARQTVRDRSNIRFEAADVQAAVARESADVVVAVDLFHHLPAAVQEAVIGQVFGLLRPGGLFLLKDLEPNPTWKRWANWWHDALMARGHPHIHVRSRDEYCRLLTAAGFSVEVVPMPQAYLAHILYIARK